MHCPVLMVDTNRWNVQQAKLDGLSTYYGSVVSKEVLERVELGGLGRLLAMTSNDEVNSLAALNFSRVFGRSEVYQLATKTTQKRADTVSRDLRGRPLFSAEATYLRMSEMIDAGARVRRTKITENFNVAQFQSTFGHGDVAMFAISPTGELAVISADEPDELNAVATGTTLIHLAEVNGLANGTAKDVATADAQGDRM